MGRTNQYGAAGEGGAYADDKGPSNRGSFWHGFANMADVTGEDELVIVRGVGCKVLDREGRWYLDATAGLWYCNAGYGKQGIAEAVERQMRELAGLLDLRAVRQRTGPVALRAVRKGLLVRVQDRAYSGIPVPCVHTCQPNE